MPSVPIASFKVAGPPPERNDIKRAVDWGFGYESIDLVRVTVESADVYVFNTPTLATSLCVVGFHKVG